MKYTAGMVWMKGIRTSQAAAEEQPDKERWAATLASNTTGTENRICQQTSMNKLEQSVGERGNGYRSHVLDAHISLLALPD
jgi:hypothetical protein